MGRGVVITGASSGLGAALARSYAAPRTALGLVGRDAVRLEAVAKSCREAGAIVETETIDVSQRGVLEAWLKAFDVVHPVELVIANAGISAGPGARRCRRTL
jgi:short-subunit dehydrogenase